MPVKYYDREDMIKISKDLVKPCVTLVDVGCGLRPYLYERSQVHICIEPFDEYIDIIKNTYSQFNMVFIKKFALEGLKLFPNDSVDTVIMLDFIEHVEKEEGLKILKEADRIAKKQIVVFTPYGYVSNDSGEKDVWGLNGAKFQEHKSGWLPEDFGDDWDIYVSKNFYPQKKPNPDNVDFYGCIWAVKNKNTKPNIDVNSIPDFVKYEIDIRKQNYISENVSFVKKLYGNYRKEKLKYNLIRFLINLTPKKYRAVLKEKNKQNWQNFLEDNFIFRKNFNN